jgi:hypothetical protein
MVWLELKLSKGDAKIGNIDRYMHTNFTIFQNDFVPVYGKSKLATIPKSSTVFVVRSENYS